MSIVNLLFSSFEGKSTTIGALELRKIKKVQLRTEEMPPEKANGKTKGKAGKTKAKTDKAIRMKTPLKSTILRLKPEKRLNNLICGVCFMPATKKSIFHYFAVATLLKPILTMTGRIGSHNFLCLMA